jgi:carboxypeptidase T
MPRYRVTIAGRGYEAMADLVRKYGIGVARHTVSKRGADLYRIQAHATGAQITTLTRAGYDVRRIEDVDRAGKRRQAEAHVAAAKTMAPIVGVAPLDRYRTVPEVESALAAAAAPPHAPFAELITLPEQTWEKRRCRAIKIGRDDGAQRVGIYILGGVHAREWGSPDICMHFVEQVTEAFRTNTGLTFGQKTFSAAKIQQLVDEKDIYVFPQANPDGRLYSMTKDAMWRKNRRPAPAKKAKCIGVDINRNYDFLWNFPRHFSPKAPIANSLDSCNETYIGPSPFSEPETRNAAWMFEAFPDIKYFVDVHSYSEDILYNWGDDVNQTTNPTMNFRNAAYDGKRGIETDTAYREYMPVPDKRAIVKLANRMQAAIAAVRGRVYKVEQSLSLYPTAGTSDDYAFSRFITDKTKAKVYSYTIEWGSPNNSTPFHPAYPEMRNIIGEVTAGLVEFCIRAGT